MNKRLIELCEFLQEYADEHPGCTKSEIAKAAADRFGLTKNSVYFDDQITVYFSSVKAQGFRTAFDHFPRSEGLTISRSWYAWFVLPGFS